MSTEWIWGPSWIVNSESIYNSLLTKNELKSFLAQNYNWVISVNNKHKSLLLFPNERPLPMNKYELQPQKDLLCNLSNMESKIY